MRKPIQILLLLLLTIRLPAQVCTAPSQTPESAILVCGTSEFHLTTPTYCGQKPIPVTCPGGFTYENTNPVFFRFACYTTGTLGFLIVPDELNSDFNWQLFDITSTNPADIFTDPALFVACNWSSEPGPTGATDDGTSLTVCGGPALNTYSKMPTIFAGRSYILMVSNKSSSSSGFSLSLTGGSASITDSIDPHMLDVTLNCDRTKIYLRLNKEIMCHSLALNGSDFSVTGGVSIVSATPNDCSNPLGSEIVILNLSAPLPLGPQKLTILNGTDGNTLIDYCNRSIPTTEFIDFLAGVNTFTPLDSVITAKCSPPYVELIFRTPINCSSIAADGSDFVITGPQTINPTVSMTGCAASSGTRIIKLNLPANYLPGTYTVNLRVGTDGNTLTNECGLQTPPGSVVSFIADAKVSATFTHSDPSCTIGAIQFDHDGANGVTSWNWDFGNGTTSSVQRPQIDFTSGSYNVKLTVTNGTCSDTWTQRFQFDNRLEAAFQNAVSICPGDLLAIKNTSTGSIDKWEWDFGNGKTSTLRIPPLQAYPDNGIEATYTIRLIATNSLLNCKDTATHTVKMVVDCVVAVPSAFTPNNDGKNDYLYPVHAGKVKDIEFRIYNRVGQLIFMSRNNTTRWNGYINGLPQDPGVYAWMLSYTNPNTGKRVFLKGTSVLIR